MDTNITLKRDRQLPIAASTFDAALARFRQARPTVKHLHWATPDGLTYYSGSVPYDARLGVCATYRFVIDSWLTGSLQDPADVAPADKLYRLQVNDVTILEKVVSTILIDRAFCPSIIEELELAELLNAAQGEMSRR